MPIEYSEGSVLVSMIWTSPTFASGNGATVLAFQGDITVSSPVGDSLASDVANQWDLHLEPIQDNSLTLQEVRWESDVRSGSVARGQSGGINGELPPSNSATIVSYYAEGKGRRNRGRNFWPGFTFEQNVNERGAIDSTKVSSLQAAFDDFFDGIATAAPGFPQAIAQSSYPGQVTPPQSPWPLVNSRVVQTVVGTQRRRVRP